MYSVDERKNFFDNIIDKIKKSEKLIGVYLIGSSSIGFRDIYSDCDFMIAYKKEYNVIDIRNEIISFFNRNDIGYIMERKWSDTILGISVYLKNGLSSDISFGPLDELKISSNQISVGVDKGNMLKKHLEESKIKVKEIDVSKEGWNFMYLMRKIKIALKRNNNIYAYQLLNDARMQIMNLEGYIEKKKMHEFKAYNELDDDFLKEIYNTIPANICKNEIEKCSDKLIEIFNNMPYEWDSNLSYLLVL